MSIRSGIITTTHLDAHGERMALSALEDMVKHIMDGIVPIGVEHDPRNSPIGRVISAEIVQLEDGEYGVKGIFELFDCELSDLTDLGGRIVIIKEFETEKLSLYYDRSFDNPDGQREIEELRKILNTDSSIYEIKKSLDPITILTIGGSFFLGAIASGFFGEIGADGYNLLKQKLGEISNSKQIDTREFILIFEFTVTNAEIKNDILVILSNPSEDDVDSAIKEFPKLDEILPKLFALNPDIKQYVFEYKEGGVKLKYSVDKYGIPLIPSKDI
jgi:hypothetical protein